MGIRSFTVLNFTPEAVADAVNMTDNKYMALKGGASTQLTRIKEVFAAGLESTTSSPLDMVLALDGTVGATLTSLTTGQSDSPDHPSFSALSSPVASFTAATTKPQRARSYLSPVPFNALGGVARIHFPFGEEPFILGNAANGGEASFSGFTGSTPAAIAGTIKYETE